MVYTNHVPDSYSNLVNYNKVSKKIIFDTSGTQKIMNQSLISLNHSHHQARNVGYSWRVLDILASNSLLITSKSDLLKEKFGKNIQKQFYQSAYEVKEKCNYFLNNKFAMEDLIAEQNEIIEKYFRWPDRIKKIEDIFKLKNKSKKKNSIIIFKTHKNFTKVPLIIILILKTLYQYTIFKGFQYTIFKRYQDTIFKRSKNLLNKRIYFLNIIKFFLKRNNNVFYRFSVRLKYFKKKFKLIKLR
jgi:hypothetical protein